MKKQTWLLKTYLWLLIAIFGLVAFHAPLSVSLGSVFPDFGLWFKSWKEILLLLLLPVGVFLALKGGLAKKMRHDWLFLAIVAYAVWHLLLLLFSETGSNQILAGLAIDLRFILFFSLMYIGISLSPVYRGKALLVGLLAAVISVVFSVLQVFILPRDILAHIGYSKATIAPYLTIDKNPDFVRINGTLRGPNPLGAYMLMVISLVSAWLVMNKEAFKRRGVSAWLVAKKEVIKRRSTLVWLAVLDFMAMIVLWSSYSRSALVATLVSFMLVLSLSFLGRVKRSAWLGLAMLLVLVLGLIYVQKDSHLVQNVLLHKNPISGSARDSNEEHLSSLQTGTERLLAQPFGAGIGSTGSASLFGSEARIIENQYLFVAHETGWLGLGLMAYISLVVLWRSFKRRADWLALGVLASGVGLMLIGFLLPVWADDTVSLVWWGLAGIALAEGGRYAKRKSA